MSRIRVALPPRRVAIFMVASALVATMSPGLALAANGPPHPVDDIVTIAEDAAASGNVLSNDTNGGTGALTVTGFAALDPSIGTLNVDANGDYSFAPAPDWNGSTSTTYTVENDKHARDGNILITVSPVQDAPVAADDTVTVDEDTATDVTAQLLANDTDADGDPLVVSGVSNATGGSVDLTAGVVTFTPDADDCGTGAGSFDYDISDGSGGSDSASATVDVTCLNEAPVASNDTVTVDEDTATDVTAQLLANDTDADGDTLVVSGVSNATGGSVDLTAGVVTFTPDADDCGTGAGSFDYDISDGSGGSDSASATVDITCENDGPVANDDTVTVDEDMATDVTAQLLANDTDVDGDTLAVSNASNASGGSVDFDGGTVTFTPDADDCGTAIGGFDYDISDGNGGSDSASATVDITCENDAPGAMDDTVTVDEDTATDVTAQLLANDTDADGDTVSVSGVSNATGGSVDLTAGAVTFTPDADLCGDGAGSFDYDVSDGNGGSDSASATVDITCENDAPVAVDDTGTVAGGSGATDFDVLANDTDPDAGDSKTLVSASVSPAAGSVSVVAGKVRFTRLASFSGAAVISYVVSDGVLQDTGTLTVTVGTDGVPPVAAAPTVHFGTGRVNETAPLRITWSATDAGVGVASYEVQVSVGGKPFTTLYSGAGTTLMRQFPFKTALVFRVRATDAANNVSPWATAEARRMVPYQRSSASLTFSGKWTVVPSTSSSGTDYLYTTTLGNRAALTFTGREVLYVAPKTSAGGYVKVTVGGTLVGRFSVKSATSQMGRIIARLTWSANGTHTVRVANDQAGRRANLDAFVILK